MSWNQRRILGALFSDSLPYSLETGFLGDHGARLTASNPSNPLLSPNAPPVPASPPALGLQARVAYLTFYIGAGI